MRESLVETLIGLIVVAVAGAFFWFALATGGEASMAPDAREVGARFSSVAGIERGADVRVAGVKVGVVREIRLDRETNEAQTVLAIDPGIEIFEDAVARIQSESLLGGSYVSLDPGYDAFDLGPVAACGDGNDLFDGSGCNMITNTQGSVDLMTLFASFANGGGGGNGAGGQSADAGQPASADGYPE